MSPGPGATSHHLPPHPEQQNRPRERVSVSKCHPRAIQRHPGQAERDRSHTARGHWLPAVVWGQPLCQHPTATSKRPWMGHISTSSWLHHSRTAPGNARAPQTPPEPAPNLHQNTRSNWELPSAPSSGLNWHRVQSYPAILIPAPCLDQSSPLGSRIVFSRASECPARLELPVAGIALPVQMFQLQGRVRPCHSHPQCPPLQEPSPSL